MNNIKLKQIIIDVLKSDDRLWNEDKTELNQTLLLDLVENIDEKLIELLLQEKELRDKFFVKIKDVYVFKTNDFRFFIEENKVDNSYTQYKNRIGLTDGKKFLKDTNDVVLNWPYKDCVLEGGQSTEEGLDTYFEYDETVTKAQEKQGLKAGTYNKKTAKRKEIFFNSVLAHDEIDRLFDHKALTNWKRFTKDGEQEVGEIKRDEDGTIRENLIIKGNNLLALHSLKKQFAGKVKLIYIDPPYNTGSDSFAYNDKFNHSTWLVFMKNRLEVAKELLHDEGAIFISINHIELGYLLVLLDEIFGRKNKLPIVTLRVGTTASYRSINVCPVNVTEYVVGYSKTEKFKPNTIYRATGYSEDYSHIIVNFEDNTENWRLKALTDIVHEKNGCRNWLEYKNKVGVNWKRKRFEEMEQIAFENKERVVSLNTLQKPSEKIKKVIEKSKENRGKVFVVDRTEKDPIYCYNGRTLAFFSSKFKEVEGELVQAEVLTNLWTDISFLGIGPEGGITLENVKKPEYLLKTIIELVTNEGDIVLDYHLGSGTTAAVAHKMNRQYIGIEQLDYQENDSVVRLKNVINGDETGISGYEDVKWQGGGDFIYFELAKWNETAKEKIL
ncbi:MAG: site-specific DNA-methyltransferase, partial [Bacteroidales bacterium]